MRNPNVVLGVMSTVIVVLSACSTPEERAAGELCPLMLDWESDVGTIFNSIGADARQIDDAEARRRGYREGLEQIRRRNDELAADVERLDDEVLAPIVADVVAGVAGAQAEIDDIEGLLDRTPEVDDGRPQVRIAQMIVRIEKVIDLPKPEMAGYEGGRLIPAFASVPECRDAVKDVP